MESGLGQGGFGPVDGRLGGFHFCFGEFQFGGGYDVFIHQQFHPAHFHLSRLGLGGGTFQTGLRSVYFYLILGRVELKKKLSFMDRLAFIYQHLIQISRHPGADLYILYGFQIAGIIVVERGFLLVSLNDRNVWLASCFFSLFAEQAASKALMSRALMPE